MKITASVSAREQRLLGIMKEVGSNAKTWAGDTGSTYLADPMKKGNAPRAVAGAAMAIGSTVLEAPEYLIAGALDNRLDAPPNVPFGRMRRDTGKLLGNVVTLHPLRAVTDVFRLVRDVPLDGLDVVGGFDHTGRAGAVRAGTRAEIGHTLAA